MAKLQTNKQAHIACAQVAGDRLLTVSWRRAKRAVQRAQDHAPYWHGQCKRAYKADPCNWDIVLPAVTTPASVRRLYGRI